MASQPWRRSTIFAGTVLAAVYLWLAGQCFDFHPVGVFNDDAVYLEQARQFVARGDMLSSIAGSPEPGTSRMLPGQSVLLVPWLIVFRDHLLPIRWIETIFMGLAGLFAGLITARCTDDRTGIVVAAALLLSPVTLTLASTLMADSGFLMVTLLVLWLLVNRDETRPWSPAFRVIVGVLLGFSVLIRIVGAVTLGVVVLWLGLRRDWRSAGVVGGTALAVILPVMVRTWSGGGGVYFLQVTQWFSNPGSAQGYLRLWVTETSRSVGTGLLGLRQTWGNLALGLILVLTCLGMVRTRTVSSTIVLRLFVVFYLGVHLFWPHPEARYFLPVWPLCLMFAAASMPSRFWIVLPAAVCIGLIVAFPSVLAETEARRALAPSIWYGSDWIAANTPQDARVMSPFPAREYLRTGRLSVHQPPTTAWCDILACASHYHVRYLRLEPKVQSKIDIRGNAQMIQPLGLAGWISSSTLVRPLASGPFDIVCEVLVDPAAFEAAFEHYVDAGKATSLDTQESQLRATLRAVPDFPEARTRLAAVSLSREEKPGEEALQLLRTEVRQYPVDVRASLVLGMALKQLGRENEAEGVLTAGRAIALSIGDGVALQQFDGIMADRPSR